LLEDFEDSPEVVKSGLYKHIYTAEYGQFGGQPVGAVVTNYDFGPGSQDIKLAQYCASVGSMSHAPFIAAAAPAMFGVDTFEEIPNLKDMESIFEGPKYAKWNSFRESEDSRYFALAMPRFMLRTPYGPETTPVKAFNYEEESGSKSENYLWGNAAFAMATKLTDSFAKFRWCPNIIGPQSGGAVEDLPVHTFEAMGQLQSKIPTEVLVSDRKEYELAEQGFISLTMRKGIRQRCVLLGKLGSEAEVLRQQPGSQGCGAELQARHTAALYDDHQPPGALHQGAAAGEHRQLERPQRTAVRAEQLDPPVRI
jgi:type VI secretion system protein ImpC